MNVGTSARELFNKHINDLSSSTCQQLVSETVCNIDDMLRSSLMPKVDHGVRQAESTASATVDKWGSKVRFSCLIVIVVIYAFLSCHKV